MLGLYPSVFNPTRVAFLTKPCVWKNGTPWVIRWMLFAAVFERLPTVEPKGLGGRPAFAPAMMFQALVIQNLYQLSDRE